MNKIKNIISILLIIFAVSFSIETFSQPPPPPSEHGSETNESGGRGAPIGSGLLILLGLGATYGGYKLYTNKKEKIEE